MSLNIKTATGLLEIGGNVTKEKVISALGYSPANETHVEDTSVHVSSEDRQTWNNKSDFSGAYADLIDAPNIVENESGKVVYADESGNIIVQIDENGLETTTVTAKNVVVGGKDVGVKFDEQKEEIGELNISLSSHTSDSTIHITADERMLWNNKSDFSGDYNDLTNAPDIVEDSSGEVVYADESGNVIAKIGENGLETTQVIADTIIANGANVGTHISDADIHVTTTEKETWNSKVDATYVDTAIANLVNSAPEELNTLDELAAALGDDENFATTVTTQIASKAAQTDLDTHTTNTANPHNVTATQVGLGNVDNTADINKPVSTAQQEALDNLKSELSESIVSEAEEWTIVDNSGNIVARVDANGLETTTVTAQNVIVNGVDLGDLGGGDMMKATYDKDDDGVVDKAAQDASGNVITEHYETKSDASAKLDTINTTLESYYTKTDIDNKGYAVATDVANTYATKTDISDMATSSYVDEQLTAKATKEHGIYYGTCVTGGDTIEKTVTLTDTTGFSLTTGTVIIVKFSHSDTTGKATLNVNNTGAKPAMQYGTTAIPAQLITPNGWEAGAVQLFVYDGTNWVRDYWNNTTYTNASLGQGYTTCNTTATAIEASLSDYLLSKGGIVSIKFIRAVPANATLNINSQGAKSIYYRGEAITANVIKAGDIATFIYYSSAYQLISIDRWQNDIDSLQTAVDGKADSSHSHDASNITSGTLSSDRLPTVPVAKGGTGATTAAGALTNLGLTATAAELNLLDGVTATTTELNYLDGVTSAIQTQLDGKAANSVATTGANGLMSAEDKTKLDCFTYDFDIPKLTIDGGAAQVIMNDDSVEISAPSGVYANGQEVVTNSYVGDIYFGGDVDVDGTLTYMQEEVAVKSDIPEGTSWLILNDANDLLRIANNSTSDDYVEIDFDGENVNIAAYNDVNLSSVEGYINLNAPYVYYYGKEVATQEYVNQYLPIALLAPVVRPTLYDNGESDSTECGLQLDFDNPNPFEVTYHIWIKNETYATENPSSSDAYYWRTGTIQANAIGTTWVFSHYQFSMFDLYNAKVYFTHECGFQSPVVDISVQG